MILASAILVVLAAAGVFSVFEARRAFIEELRAQIGESLAAYVEVYRAGGRDALQGAVQSLAQDRTVPQHVAGLFTPDGAHLAGRIATLPVMTDETTVRMVNTQTGRTETFLVQRVDLADAVLVAGRSMRLITTATERIAITMPVLFLLIAAATVAAGIVVHRALAGELLRLESVLRRFAAGDMQARVALEGAPRDSIEDIGALVNRHLDEVQASVSAMERAGAAIAHDLRTPLTRVSLRLQALAGTDGLPREAADTLDAATEELQGLSQICDAILRISAIEASTNEAAFTTFDLGALAREIAESYGPVFEDAGLVLETALPTLPATVRADRRMIGQAVVNLLSNVLAHCPPGTTARLSVLPEGAALRLVVADDGPGVPAEERERIFEPFRRLDPSRSGAGTGLGLALVRAVARHHGAAIEATDARPGLSVAMTLPRA